MKPGELYKPYGSDCVLLCVAPDTFTVEAGACPFHPSPLDGKIHFDPNPPMHRAWHWSDLATDEQVALNLLDEDLVEEVLSNEILHGKKLTIMLNAKLYLYENSL